jgi:hypothetical protein
MREQLLANNTILSDTATKLKSTQQQVVEFKIEIRQHEKEIELS